VIYFYAEDQMHYTEKSIDKLKKKYNLDDIITHPVYSDLRDTAGRNIAFMASYMPSDFDRKMKNSNYFSVVELPNKYGILTSRQKELGIDESQIMEQRYGVSFYKPEFTFDDMGGATEFKAYIKRVLVMESLNLKIKGIFMVGIPGTGKSFSAKCFAGSTGRILVELNLATLMFLSNPIFALKAIFELLSKQNSKFIIWIDEIEKQINESEKSKQVLGALLTILNDLNTSTSKFSVDAIFLATANNITSISENNPEFLRKGRFDELFFLNYQKPDNAKAVFELYRDKTNKLVREDLFYRVLFKQVNQRVGLVVKDEAEVAESQEIKSLVVDTLSHAQTIYSELDETITQLSYANAVIKNERMEIEHQEQSDYDDDDATSFNMSVEKQEFILREFKKRYLEKFSNTKAHLDAHAKFIDRFSCDFDIDKMYQVPEIVHLTKNKTKIDSKLYIYTPSEIENYVSEWFTYKVQQKNIDDDTHRKLVQRLIPLQIAMKEGIEKLTAQKEMFIEVN